MPEQHVSSLASRSIPRATPPERSVGGLPALRARGLKPQSAMPKALAFGASPVLLGAPVLSGELVLGGGRATHLP
jgi:hypothetical protein